MTALVDSSTDWTCVLDSLEQHVKDAERLLDRDPAHLVPAWVPPLGIGDFPAGQATRAAELLARMRFLMTRYERESGVVHHELTFVRAATAAAPSKRPMFIDASL